jgi:calcium-binding protein CML
MIYHSLHITILHCRVKKYKKEILSLLKNIKAVEPAPGALRPLRPRRRREPHQAGAGGAALLPRPRPAAGDEIHTLIAAMDADGNGTVEFDELSSLAPLLLGPCRPAVAVDHAQLAEAFRAFDRDGNGFISAAELARSMALMGHPICYVELTDTMKEADTDGDGVISF